MAQANTPPKHSQPSQATEDDSLLPGTGLVRLNKLLAERGIASRRKCDELIAAGKVSVDGDIVTELGTKVDPELQRVEVGGSVLEPHQRRRYYLLNKPRGVVCTNEPREARLRAIDLVTDPQAGRIFCVGRLDEDSEGLILMTNDGEFAQRVAHPRYGVLKTYRAKIRGRIEGEALENVRKGVHLAEGRTEGAFLRVTKRSSQFTIIEVTIGEGKNREIRRIFAHVGFKVLRLKRIAIGPIQDPRLKDGQWRPLLRFEIEALQAGPGEGKPRPRAAKERPRASRSFLPERTPTEQRSRPNSRAPRPPARVPRPEKRIPRPQSRPGTRSHARPAQGSQGRSGARGSKTHKAFGSQRNPSSRNSSTGGRGSHRDRS